MADRELPMFPLGTVLFPHGVLPLRIFEARYLALLEACLAGDGEFGVVLIERGFEVGGGDQRFEVGTLARFLQVAEIPDGQRLALAVGTRRLKVSRWLPDDPFPRAVVEVLAEPVPPAGFSNRVDTAEGLLRRALALRSEAGIDVGDAGFVLSDDPQAAAYQICVLSSLPSIDLQGLLETDPPGERLERLIALLEEEIDVLGRRLRGG